jgi:peroxiredoxin
MRLVAALAAVLTLGPVDAQDAMEILHKTAAVYQGAKSYRVEGVDVLERTARGQKTATRRPFRASRLNGAMRVDFADGGMRLTDGHFEWNYNTGAREYTKKVAPWDSRGRRSFNAFFYNFESIAEFVQDAGFIGVPGKDGFVIEVHYLLPAGIEEIKTYWIDGERYVVLRETSNPAPMFEQGPVHLTRTVTFQKIDLHPALDPALFTPPAERPALSGLAPDFTLTDLAGTPVELQDLRGKAVLLYFWATWCHTCHEEMAKVEEIARDYGDRGLVVLGINDEEPGIAAEYLKAGGHAIRSLVDRWQDVYKKFAVESIPEVIVIAKDGRIASVSGYGEDAALRSGLRKAGVE